LSKREAGLVEEGKAQLLRAAHAAHSSVESRGGLAKIRSAEIGELLAFDVSPQVLDGIEFRSIAGQALDREPIGLTAEIPGHLGATMSRQAIPDQDDPATAEVSSQFVEEGNEALGVVAVGLDLEQKAAALTVEAVGQHRRRRHLLPVEGVDQDRGFSAGCPGATDRGTLRDSALVLECDPRLLAAGFFLTTGQRSAIHCRIASSFRSRALRAGRCNVQPIWRKTRHTCPGW